MFRSLKDHIRSDLFFCLIETLSLSPEINIIAAFSSFTANKLGGPVGKNLFKCIIGRSIDPFGVCVFTPLDGLITIGTIIISLTKFRDEKLSCNR